MSSHQCPRKRENPMLGLSPLLDGEDTWRADDTCSYCGSLNPDTLMARVEAGDVQLVPTDKSYKVYVRNNGGEGFQQTYRNCPQDAKCKGPNECTHWVTRNIDETKFYFQHLSEDQRKRFVDLLNDSKLHLAAPGYFYVMPFFCKR